MKINIPTHNAVVNMPDDMSTDQIKAELGRLFPNTPRPDHDNLMDAAVTGADSLDLQEMAPEVKPVAKMTFGEFVNEFAGREMGERFGVVMPDGTSYVVDPSAVDPQQAIAGIIGGNDSKILGYPERGPHDAAVTKQGDIVTDLDVMRDQAAAGNVIWAAQGDKNPLLEKAQMVSTALEGKHG